MAEKKARAGQGTFAKLYDVQEELSQRGLKPLGRPRKKVRRKPTTIHLTQSEMRKLSKLHLLVNEHFSINRSELVGVAIDVLTVLIEEKIEEIIKTGGVRDVEVLRQSLIDFIKS
jgi:hypothetical protein